MAEIVKKDKNRPLTGEQLALKERAVSVYRASQRKKRTDLFTSTAAATASSEASSSAAAAPAKKKSIALFAPIGDFRFDFSPAETKQQSTSSSSSSSATASPDQPFTFQQTAPGGSASSSKNKRKKAKKKAKEAANTAAQAAAIVLDEQPTAVAADLLRTPSSSSALTVAAAALNNTSSSSPAPAPSKVAAPAPVLATTTSSAAATTTTAAAPTTTVSSAATTATTTAAPIPSTAASGSSTASSSSTTLTARQTSAKPSSTTPSTSSPATATTPAPAVASSPPVTAVTAVASSTTTTSSVLDDTIERMIAPFLLLPGGPSWEQIGLLFKALTAFFPAAKLIDLSPTHQAMTATFAPTTSESATVDHRQHQPISVVVVCLDPSTGANVNHASALRAAVDLVRLISSSDPSQSRLRPAVLLSADPASATAALSDTRLSGVVDQTGQTVVRLIGAHQVAATQLELPSSPPQTITYSYSVAASLTGSLSALLRFAQDISSSSSSGPALVHLEMGRPSHRFPSLSSSSSSSSSASAAAAAMEEKEEGEIDEEDTNTTATGWPSSEKNALTSSSSASSSVPCRVTFHVAITSEQQKPEDSNKVALREAARKRVVESCYLTTAEVKVVAVSEAQLVSTDASTPAAAAPPAGVSALIKRLREKATTSGFHVIEAAASPSLAAVVDVRVHPDSLLQAVHVTFQ